MALACDDVREAVRLCALSPAVESHLRGCRSCDFDRTLREELRRADGPTTVFLAGARGPAFAVAPDAVRTGALYLGRYRIEAFLGDGAQGCVWRAVDELMGDEVALKFLTLPAGAAPDGNVRAVKHDNVCRVHDVKHDAEAGVHFLVMEHVHGEPLSHRLGRLTPAAALDIYVGVCRGVMAMHQQGVLHLDLKPENILLRENTPLVTDFGMAVRLRDGRAESPRGGTRGYMAPEHEAGRAVDEGADVFSLGVLLEKMHPAPGRRLRAAIGRATAAARADRFATVAELLAAVIRPGPRWPRRGRLAAAGALAVAAGVSLFMLSWTPSAPRAAWRADLWGLDTIPARAWNVARNVSGRGLPAIETPHRFFACGRHPWELLDGLAQYGTWEHGLAFAPPPGVTRPRYGCVSYGALKGGRCGRLEPDDRLCRFDGKGNVLLLEARGRDIGRFSASELETIGHVYEREECGFRSVDVVLDDEYVVFAVRLWHHGPENTPREFRVEVLDDGGRWREMGRTEWAMPPAAERQNTGATAPSAPTDADFTPVHTRRVRVLVNTCSTLSDDDLRSYRDRHRDPKAAPREPGIFWLYELEVFAQLSRRQAWRQWLKP
jgi:hypothetical protein